jgi:ABC-type amino acid transport substrate-binding protein
MSSFDFSAASWRKSSASSANGSCVEVARLAAASIGARDSKHGTKGAVLQFSAREWNAFIGGLKAGDYDLS